MKKISSFLIALFYFTSLLQILAQGPMQKSGLSQLRDSVDSRFTVTATVMDDDTWCRVEWPDPIGNPWELAYDDGEADDYFVYQNPGSLNANKFIPTFHPFIVTGGKIYVGDGSFPGPFLGTSFRVLVYDDDGEDGLPGTALDSIDVMVNNYQWVEFEGLTAEITEGNFYLAMKQLAPSPDAAPVGVDTDNPTYSRSYSYFLGAPGWVLCPLQDLMIRAFITGYNEPARAIDSFLVARFSGFEMNESPLTGDTTLLDTISLSEYNDYSWETLIPGHYAYGVKTHFTDSLWSDFDVSNIVSHMGDGHPLPFLEQWNNGTFGTNNWIPESENWSINWQEGQPGPSAQFTWDPIQDDYQLALESYPLLADSLAVGYIYLDFDLKLDNYQPTGNEQMLVQVWNWGSQAWGTVSTYSNEDGSFDWMSEHLNITDQALGKVFKIRFLATGENSLDLVGWYLDNIHVYRDCKAPSSLTVESVSNQNGEGILVEWENPYGPYNNWIEWDDGINSGNSIGTGTEAEFDCAARWAPSQLHNYQGYEVTQVSFYPSEAQADYFIRIWIGENAEILVIDQPVNDPVIGQWNDITLLSPISINIHQELWVGYHVNAEMGYPAGVDNGPAIDGYGNMMNYGGWQTLLEINPEMDYNWNIKANIQREFASDTVTKYAVYRSDRGDPYYFRGYAVIEEFLDDSAIVFENCPMCFHVTAIYSSETDWCESAPSNESCEICEGIKETEKISDIIIYPNPASDMLYIESEQEIESVCIFDSRGITIEQLNNRTNGKWSGGQVKMEVPLNGLAPGLYLLRVETESGVVGRKVLVR